MSFSHINSPRKGPQGASATAMTSGSDGETYMVDGLTLLPAVESTTSEISSSDSEHTGSGSPRVGMPTIDKLRCATAMYGTKSNFDETEADRKMATLLYVYPSLAESFANYTLLDHANAFGAAQICYPAEMSIFVANLPNRDYGDLALLNSVLAEFSQYGKCFGVVRRNVNPKTGMVRPYVILQYTRLDYARMACQQIFRQYWHGTFIGGRKLRIFQAQAPRSIFVTRKDSDVGSNMARLGQITSVRRVGYVEAESRFKIQKDGVMVKFCMHGHYRMAKEMLGAAQGEWEFHYGLD
ncbi:hypothetical protein D0860_06817 [Hortaea werneckii]|uniref:RRM domain-containing protein n=1 Tax=Hortaea werneckii TaxID=91943 RepID=A0A3M7GRJ4_HORWE|nr:hypothetical protein D0860_06817 [Hortaea werneckii]